MGDLISTNDEFIFKSNYKLREPNISPWNTVIDALPAEWCESLTTSVSIVSDEPFNLHNEIKF